MYVSYQLIALNRYMYVQTDLVLVTITCSRLEGEVVYLHIAFTQKSFMVYDPLPHTWC